MKRYDLIVVGAGPSGLSAAIEAAKRGLKVVVFDENEKPGGQLFKQIHKFFGPKEHKAKIRGFVIGEELLKEADDAGVEVELNATVIGMYQDKEIVVNGYRFRILSLGHKTIGKVRAEKIKKDTTKGEDKKCQDIQNSQT